MLYFMLLIVIAVICILSIIHVKAFNSNSKIVFNFGLILIPCFFNMILYDKNLQTSYDKYLRDCEDNISKHQKCELDSIKFKVINKRG